MCVLFTTEHCIQKTDSDIWRGWQLRCSWTSTWRRTRSSNLTRRLARIRASSRWRVLSSSARLLHKNSSKTKKSLDLPLYVQVICYFFQDYLKSTCFRWTSRSWRTLWRIESRNMLLCNTLGTRRRSKSNLIHHHTLLFTQYLWCSGHFLTACPRKCKSFVGDPISNPGCWQSTEWWAKGWDPPWQTSKMSQLTSGPPRILTNILCILINIPCILINIPSILTNILNFCQAHSDAGCFLLAV